MTLTAFRFLATAWLLVLIRGATGYKFKVHTDRIDCLKQFNRARKRAGLAKFKVALDDFNSLPLVGTEYEAVCQQVMQTGTINATGIAPEKGTYAYMALSEGKADCEAAVKYWESAVTSFSDLPPAYTKAAQVYKDPVNTSLVALFNPNSNSTADCIVLTCKAQSEGSKHGLLCLSSPKALDEGKAPFTKEEWGKITVGIASPASAAAPALLPIAILALGIAMH